MSDYTPEIYAAVLENLPNGIYVVDRNRRIHFWNAGAEHITGYLRHEVIGRLCPENLLRHCCADKLDMCNDACPLSATMHDGKPREIFAFLRHKEGHRVPVRVRAIPVRDQHGTIIGAAETFDEHIHFIPLEAVVTNSVPGTSSVDPLTGIRDHRSILADVCSSLSSYGETEIPFGVLGIAIDHLEDFTRSHGRRGADALLRVVAQTLVKNLPPEDLLGKWSQDRFVVVVASSPPAALARLATLLARVISMDEVPWWGDRLAVSVTIGGTTVRHGDTADSLLERVEDAVLQAATPEAKGLRII
jgi:PAS domain S-box-containing protein/diguanylate cyclase (GGDEF)-like protein